MKGGYDLHGRYYPNINDALNAEMAQCNEIDNRYNRKQIQDLERKLHNQQQQAPNQEIDFLMGKCQELQQRIEQLEQLTFHLRND